MSQILYWCEHTGRSYWEYVSRCEGTEIWDFLAEVWETMKAAIHRGLDAEGVLPGPLHLRRKASSYYIRSKGYKNSLQSRGLLYAYALAVSEENAAGGKIVTAPTCGACAVVPAVLYHLQQSRDFSDARILRALATAGLVGNIVKYNASVRSKVDAKQKLELPVPWLQQLPANCLEEALHKSSMQLKWDWNITWV